ncbi:MAG: hypothetical protein ISS72_05885 [Candidatus Brocadiae bacterium]|nr:hypothetical protein [Candidatus Brocadiia bacterium]
MRIESIQSDHHLIPLPVTTHDLHVHLLAAIPNASYLEAFIRQPVGIDDGFATAPDRPGHGIEFDWDALEAHRAE